MSYRLLNIGFFLKFFNYLHIKNKSFIFFIGFLLFGTLSFITYHPTNLSEPNLLDKEIVLLNNPLKLNSTQQDSFSDITNSTHLNNKFALIVGTYTQEFNAQLFKEEMNRRGFKDCSIIYNQNPSKYWVALKIYNKKVDANFDRERFLLDGWIKKM